MRLVLVAAGVCARQRGLDHGRETGHSRLLSNLARGQPLCSTRRGRSLVPWVDVGVLAEPLPHAREAVLGCDALLINLTDPVQARKELLERPHCEEKFTFRAHSHLVLQAHLLHQGAPHVALQVNRTGHLSLNGFLVPASVDGADHVLVLRVQRLGVPQNANHQIGIARIEGEKVGQHLHFEVQAISSTHLPCDQVRLVHQRADAVQRMHEALHGALRRAGVDEPEEWQRRLELLTFGVHDFVDRGGNVEVDDAAGVFRRCAGHDHPERMGVAEDKAVLVLHDLRLAQRKGAPIQ
mmetsp:Transcript_58615/g.163525  ORF Transcript_58615/g.163525 Transcript_58615/m.163525 type:complete len:295 (-) Transcript_58615:8-892(-)